MKEIRGAINKAWDLGGDRFKQQIEKQTGQRVRQIQRGDDRKSNTLNIPIDSCIEIKLLTYNL